MSNEAKIKITADSSSAIQNIEKLFAAILKIGDDANLSSEQMQALATVLNATKEVFVALSGVIDSNTNATNKNKDANKKSEEQEKKSQEQKERLKAAVQALAAGMGGSVGQITAFAFSLLDAAKKGGFTEVALLSLTGVVSLIGRAWNKVSKEVQDSAREGQKSSQVWVGATEIVDDKLGDLISVLIDGMAPAIAGMTKVISKVIEGMTEWAQKGSNMKAVGSGVIDVFIASIKAVELLSAGYQNLNIALGLYDWLLGKVTTEQINKMQAAKDASDKYFESIESDLIDLANKIDTGFDLSGIENEVAEAGVTSVKLMEELDAKLKDESVKSHADRLSVLQMFVAQHEQYLVKMPATAKKINSMINSENREAGQEQLDYQKSLIEQSNKDLEDSINYRLSLTDGSKKAELEIVKEYQDTFNSINADNLSAQFDYKAKINQLERDAAKEKIEIDKRNASEAKKTQEESLEEKRKALENQIEREISLTDGSEQSKLEVYLKYQEQYNALHEEDLQSQYEYQTNLNEMSLSALSERKQKELETETEWIEKILEAKKASEDSQLEAKQQQNEKFDALLEERLAQIEVEGGSEVEIANKKISLYKKVTHVAEQSAATRKKVELGLLAEQKKINTAHEKQYQDYAKKISSTVSGALNQMIFEHKSFNEVVGGLIREFAMKAVATFVEMAATAIAKDVATAGSAVATSAAKKAAQSATVPSAIAAWTASIPVIGPSVYSTYLAIFKGLMASGEAAMAHEEGGPLGRVPGFGRSDSFGFTDKANSQEFILNERGRKAFGDEALSYANETGANPFNSMAGSGDPDRVLGTLKIVVELRNMLTPADDVARAVAPAISKALSQHVIFNNGTLIASKTK